MQRLPDWRERLRDYILEANSRVYEPGFFDCGLGAAAGAVEALTGEDFGKPYRGNYTTVEEGYALIRKIDGCATLRGLATKKLGRPKPVAFARHGDIVLDHRGALGFMNFGKAMFVGSEETTDGRLVGQGLVSFPRQDMRVCWHV